ncbi:MAG: urease accessory protein UreE [Rhodobacter sp.]|nr:urease accessory protein UreE [Rhodobacter sp.]
MTDLPKAQEVHRRGHWADAADSVTLGYDERILRRRRLVTAGGTAVLVDLPETTSLDHGDALELSDGRLVEVVAAAEPVLVITGDLPRIAWHIGNRHTPCQIEGGRMLIRRDHVLEAMLRQLGAGVAEAVAPFTPEGGAYGHGRTMGHDHGDGGDHGHAQGHGHVHHYGGHTHPDDPEPEREPE